MDKDNLTLEQSMMELLKTVPRPVQEFIQKGKIGDVARSLMDRYVLHIDHGAILEYHLTLLLLGVEGPDEFAEALYDKLPVSEKTVKDILIDINQEVFVPLREEERKNGMENTPPLARPVEVARPSTAPRPNVPVPNYSAQPTQYSHLENKLPNRPPVAPSIGARPVNPVPQGNVAAAKPTQPVSGGAPLPPKIVMPRSKLLDDHEEPHIEFNKLPTSRPSINLISPPPPAPRPPVAPVARPAAAPIQGSGAPANLPGAFPPRPSEAFGGGGPQAVPPLPPKKSYPVDPYHEPIE